MIALILMNFIVAISAFLLTYRIFKFINFIDSLLSLFILYFAQIILTELILGTLGILYLRNIILLNLVFLLMIWCISRNNKSSFNVSGLKEQLSKILSNKILLLGICLILGFGLIKIFINLVNPPFGWDNLNYHFTFPVEWLKHGNLDIPITISDDPSPSYYPINGSLFYLWLILPLRSVFLADLGQAPFFILSFLAVYSIARKIGLERSYSFYCAGLFFIIPNFFKQLSIAYVDVMVAALFLVCVSFLFSLDKRFSGSCALLYSLSLGLLLGTKTVALPYSALLFLPFIYLCARKNQKAYFLLISLAVVIIFGGFSYLRNFLETGNPLYPLDLKLFGKTVFQGVIDTATYRAHFRPEDYRLSKLLFHEGLGAQSLIFILPGILLALPAAALRKNKALNFNLIYCLVLPVLVYLVYRYLIPLANVRYLYALLGLGIVLGFYTAGALSIPKKVIDSLAALCALVSVFELAKRQELIVSMILTFMLFFLLPYLIRIRIPRKTPAIGFTLILIIFALILLERDYVKNEFPRYKKMVKYSGFWPDATQAWDWLNSNTAGNNIAYVGRPVPFPLYGANFKNNVYYVSVNKIEPAKLHYFPNSKYRWDYGFLSLHRNLEQDNNYRGNADYAVWLNNLIKKNTDYLFIYSLHQTKNIEFPLEDIWAKDHPDRFMPAFGSAAIHIYKVSK